MQIRLADLDAASLLQLRSALARVTTLHALAATPTLPVVEAGARAHEVLSSYNGARPAELHLLRA